MPTTGHSTGGRSKAGGQSYCGTGELLIAAAHLVNGDTIHRMPMTQVRYHILMIDARNWAELLALFADLDLLRGQGGRRKARLVARGAQAGVLQREYAVHA